MSSENHRNEVVDCFLISRLSHEVLHERNHRYRGKDN